MAKVWGPLHSDDVKGTIGKVLTFGKDVFGNWARAYYPKKYTRSATQNIVRTWFKNAVGNFKRMNLEEQFLWDLALKNYKEYYVQRVAYTKRWAKCLFLHHVLLDKSFTWEGSPFPPELKQLLATDIIPGYNQLVADVETLTGLSFCKTVNPYFFPYLGTIQSKGHPEIGTPTAGLCNYYGIAIAFDQDIWAKWSAYQKDSAVGHELTHAIMFQHDWDYTTAVSDSEIIAYACGDRIANNNLTPVYTYKGKTLSELVPTPSCP